MGRTNLVQLFNQSGAPQGTLLCADVGTTHMDTTPGFEQGQKPTPTLYQNYCVLWNFGVNATF